MFGGVGLGGGLPRECGGLRDCNPWAWVRGGLDGEGEGRVEGAEVVFEVGEGAEVGVGGVCCEVEDGACECGVGL